MSRIARVEISEPMFSVNHAFPWNLIKSQVFLILNYFLEDTRLYEYLKTFFLILRDDIHDQYFYLKAIT